MTDDLVKRLREHVIHLDAWGKEAIPDADLVEEAADRIEKLEAALRDLSDGWECCPVSQAMRRVAREALEGEDDAN